MGCHTIYLNYVRLSDPGQIITYADETSLINTHKNLNNMGKQPKGYHQLISKQKFVITYLPQFEHFYRNS